MIHAARLPDTIQKFSFREYNQKLKTGRRSESGILAMTYYSAILHLGLRSNAFAPNVILIDEAGQIPFSYSGTAGLFGAGSHILFGDDAQLPPIFDSRLKDHPLSLSLFQQVRRAHPAEIRTLDETFRLNDEICQYISERYYRNSDTDEPFLYSSAEAAGRRLTLNFPTDTPNWIQELLSPSPSIVFCGNRFSEPSQNQLNPQEAQIVAELVSWSFKLGLKKEQIAVISPFRRQALQIRSILLNEGGLSANELPIIDTVERVQGASVDLTIISLSATDPAFIAMVYSFLYSPNRLNVALSRAKRKVIVLGNLHESSALVL
jgi:DNA replication ATP-dependent helicase Dna2